MLKIDSNLGHKNKKAFKAKIFNLLMDYQNGKTWNLSEIDELKILTDAYSKIDNEYVKLTIARYENKIGCKICVALVTINGD